MEWSTTYNATLVKFRLINLKLNCVFFPILSHYRVVHVLFSNANHKTHYTRPLTVPDYNYHCLRKQKQTNKKKNSHAVETIIQRLSNQRYEDNLLRGLNVKVTPKCQHRRILLLRGLVCLCEIRRHFIINSSVRQQDNGHTKNATEISSKSIVTFSGAA